MGHVSPSLSTTANSINQSVGQSVGRSVLVPRVSLWGGRPAPQEKDPGNEVESISQSIGRSVNKASGLTDLARPRDVVVDFRVNVVQ